jgi:hypothetical protein
MAGQARITVFDNDPSLVRTAPALFDAEGDQFAVGRVGAVRRTLT